jgi:hypothetical protein
MSMRAFVPDGEVDWAGIGQRIRSSKSLESVASIAVTRRFAGLYDGCPSNIHGRCGASSFLNPRYSGADASETHGILSASGVYPL